MSLVISRPRPPHKAPARTRGSEPGPPPPLRSRYASTNTRRLEEGCWSASARTVSDRVCRPLLLAAVHTLFPGIEWSCATWLVTLSLCPAILVPDRQEGRSRKILSFPASFLRRGFRPPRKVVTPAHGCLRNAY